MSCFLSLSFLLSDSPRLYPPNLTTAIVRYITNSASLLFERAIVLLPISNVCHYPSPLYVRVLLVVPHTPPHIPPPRTSVFQLFRSHYTSSPFPVLQLVMYSCK